MNDAKPGQGRFYTFSSIYSYVLHPFLIPTIGAALLLFGNTYFQLFPAPVKLSVMGIIIINTVFVPVLCILIFRKFDLSGCSIESRKDRIPPMIFVGIGYLLCAFMLSKFVNVRVIDRMLIASMASIFVCILINFYWRMSVHTTAMGALVGMLAAINMSGYGYMPAALLIIIALTGMLATARLYTGRNNIWQAGAGFAVGLAVVFFVFYC